MKALIMAGGGGTRLWPVSRDARPKQFQAFIGETTMLQQTYARLTFLHPQDIFVSCNEQYLTLVKEQLPELPPENIIQEPSLRDTGPSLCFAAHILAKRGFEKEVMVVVYADHLMRKPEQFTASLAFATEYSARTNKLGVIGVRAQYPNPSLGYIKIGKALEESAQGLEAYQLERFVEKPTLEKAKEFLNSYKYLWNTGLYLGPVELFLKAFAEHAPVMFEKTKKSETYSDAPKMSFDFAVTEKLPPSSVFVVPADLGWNDIGNWEALFDELRDAPAQNVTAGNVLTLDTNDCLIINKTPRLIATFGLKDIVIIDTHDALLVIPKKQAGEIKNIVNELKKASRAEYL